MGLRETIITQLDRYIEGISEMPATMVDEDEEEVRQFKESARVELPHVRHMLKQAVPIEILTPDDPDLITTALKYGSQLLGDGEMMPTQKFEHLQLPYPYIFLYGTWFHYRSSIVMFGGMNPDVMMSAYVFQNIAEGGDRGPAWMPTLAFSQYNRWAYENMGGNRINESDIDNLIIEITGTGSYLTPDIDKQEQFGNAIVAMFTAIYGLLNMKQTITVDVPAPDKLNRKRERQGKEPISAMVQVKLDPKFQIRSYQGGTHASPRPHWRRGHVRTLSSGKRVAVSPHMVMGEAPLPQGYTIKK